MSAQRSLRLTDAIHLAIARHARAAELLTHDEKLKKLPSLPSCQPVLRARTDSGYTPAMIPAPTAQQLDAYRRTMRRRAAQTAERRARRREAAWTVAREAAELLRSRYGARRVLVFGSLPEGTHFGEHSDIDLAVEGIDPGEHYAALGRLLGLSPDFEFDLVDLGACPPHLRAAILAEGRQL